MTVIRFVRCRRMVTVTWGLRNTLRAMAAEVITASASSNSMPARLTRPIWGISA